MVGKHRTRELRNVARMPVDAAFIAARLGKPGDLRHPVTDRDQKHSTVSAATQANTRDLAKWHVDHATHSQPVLIRLTVFHHARGSLWTSRRMHNHYLMISRSPRRRWRAARVALRGRVSSRSRPFPP